MANIRFNYLYRDGGKALDRLTIVEV